MFLNFTVIATKFTSSSQQKVGADPSSVFRYLLIARKFFMLLEDSILTISLVNHWYNSAGFFGHWNVFGRTQSYFGEVQHYNTNQTSSTKEHSSSMLFGQKKPTAMLIQTCISYWKYLARIIFWNLLYSIPLIDPMEQCWGLVIHHTVTNQQVKFFSEVPKSPTYFATLAMWAMYNYACLGTNLEEYGACQWCMKFDIERMNVRMKVTVKNYHRHLTELLHTKLK